MKLNMLHTGPLRPFFANTYFNNLSTVWQHTSLLTYLVDASQLDNTSVWFDLVLDELNCTRTNNKGKNSFISNKAGPICYQPISIGIQLKGSNNFDMFTFTALLYIKNLIHFQAMSKTQRYPKFVLTTFRWLHWRKQAELYVMSTMKIVIYSII